MHDKDVNKIAECNLLHDIINPPKRAKKLNSHYSPILQGFMNTRKGKKRFKNLIILLYIGCSSTIVTGRLVGRINPEKYALIQRHTQAGNITTNLKVKVDLTLPTLSATNIVTWKFHVNDYDKGMCDMILRQYL